MVGKRVKQICFISEDWDKENIPTFVCMCVVLDRICSSVRKVEEGIVIFYRRVSLLDITRHR